MATVQQVKAVMVANVFQFRIATIFVAAHAHVLLKIFREDAASSNIVTVANASLVRAPADRVKILTREHVLMDIPVQKVPASLKYPECLYLIQTKFNRQLC